MNYRFLGKSTLLISEIGFGCMSLGDEYAAAESLIHEALDLGINFFDTADLYQQGLNETNLGKSLVGNRKQAIVSSKVGNQWRTDGSGWDWNPKKEYILSAVDKSLRRLKTDYIDLYQLHGGTIDDPLDETIQAFEQLQQMGKIRFYGISSIRPNVIREYIKRSHLVSVMMQYNLLDRRPEEASLPFLRQNEIGVLARGSLAKGILANKEPAEYLDYTKDEIIALARILQGFQDKERTIAQTALRFVLQQPGISSAVVGIRTNDQIREAAGAADSSFLSADEISHLQQVFPLKQYVEHR